MQLAPVINFEEDYPCETNINQGNPKREGGERSMSDIKKRPHEVACRFAEFLLQEEQTPFRHLVLDISSV